MFSIAFFLAEICCFNSCTFLKSSDETARIARLFTNLTVSNIACDFVVWLWRRTKFRFRRRSDTSKMAEHLIDLVSKPMCLIKLIDFSF